MKAKAEGLEHRQSEVLHTSSNKISEAQIYSERAQSVVLTPDDLFGLEERKDEEFKKIDP